MSTTKIEIDDTNPFIFSSGPWDQQSDGGAFNNTRSLTTSKGATKVVRFIGTSITVMGGLQQYAGTSTSPLLSQYSIDGKPPVIYAPDSPALYEIVPYYQSSKLSMGEHVLLMMNMVDNDLIWLDYFIIEAQDGGTPTLLLSDGGLIPDVSTSIATNNTGQYLQTTLTSLRMVTSTVNVIVSHSHVSTTPTSTIKQSLTESTISRDLITTSTSLEWSTRKETPNSQTIYPNPSPTVINYHNTNGSSPSPLISKAVIVGIVCGIFVLMLLIGIGMGCVHKRRERRQMSMTTAIMDPFDVETNTMIDHVHFITHARADGLCGSNNDSTTSLAASALRGLWVDQKKIDAPDQLETADVAALPGLPPSYDG